MNAAYLLTLLHEIELGERPIRRITHPLNTCGVNEFLGEDGMIVRIFCDEAEWDYVDSVRFPDGTEYEFWRAPSAPRWEEIQRYKVSPQAAREIYGMQPNAQTLLEEREVE